jgi:DNA adenine methylase
MNPSLPSLEHLRKISNKLEGIEIQARSYKDIFPLVKKGNFVYLDPPYPKLNDKEQFQQYTIEKFSKQHQIELASFANSLNQKGCYVMISNSNVPLIRELYNKWNIVEIPVIRYISC